MDKKDNNKKVNRKRVRKRRKRRKRRTTTSTTTNTNTNTIPIPLAVYVDNVVGPNGPARAKWRSNINKYLTDHHRMVSQSRIKAILISSDDGEEKDKENE